MTHNGNGTYDNIHVYGADYSGHSGYYGYSTNLFTFDSSNTKLTNFSGSNYRGYGTGLLIGSSDSQHNANNLILNGSINGTTNGITTYSQGSSSGILTNTTIIDVKTSNCTYNYYISEEDGATVNNTKLANIDISSVNYGGGEYTLLQPLNARVLNTTGVPVVNANLTINVTGLDSIGNVFVNTTTDNNGCPVSPIYVSDYFRDSVEGYTYYNSSTVTASKLNKSNTSVPFNPDETWLSDNSSEPNGTSVIVMLDVAGEGEEPAYWIPTEGKHYLNVPETHTWFSGSWTVTISGTYENEQTEITGVEVRP
jgi:hypothetical protein